MEARKGLWKTRNHPESSKEEWTTQSSAEAFWEGGLDIEHQERIKKSESPVNAENLTKYNHYCPVREFCLPGNSIYQGMIGLSACLLTG